MAVLIRFTSRIQAIMASIKDENEKLEKKREEHKKHIKLGKQK
jgi:hypothetical protein